LNEKTLVLLYDDYFSPKRRHLDMMQAEEITDILQGAWHDNQSPINQGVVRASTTRPVHNATSISVVLAAVDCTASN